MARNSIVAAAAAVALGGCIAGEVALSRQGRASGTAASGGLGFVGTSSVYREDGVQNGSLGMSVQMLQLSPQGDGTVVLGADARYARQLTASWRWRGFGRASFGLAPCDLQDCGDREADAASARVLGVALGIERFVWGPDEDAAESATFFSTSLGIVYSHARHEMLGDGHFLGLELGMRVGINRWAPPRAGAGEP